MRLGKPLEHLQAALRAALTTGPVEETLTTIARQVGYFGYLTYDAIVWVRPGFQYCHANFLTEMLHRPIASNSLHWLLKLRRR
jgi:hypothetical protein